MEIVSLALALFLDRTFPAKSLVVSQSILSTGFAFCLQWNVLENGYLEPHANTRIDFHKERGKVSWKKQCLGIVKAFIVKQMQDR